MTEPLNDYAEAIIKARKHLDHLESLLRMRDMKSAMEELPKVEEQCLKLRNFIYRESENGKD